MTRSLHPPELERQRKRARFDPVVEGTRHGLSRELSLTLWERVCADATDSAGVCDIDQAQRRFHELAPRIAARGGRLGLDPGRITRAATETTSTPRDAWRLAELAPRMAGRETLVTAEARRWSAMSAELVAAPASTEAVTEAGT